MSLGFVVLAHENLDRVAQFVRHLSTQGCPVSLHIDKCVSRLDFDTLQTTLSDLDNIVYPKRIHCDWGQFSIVEATQNAAQLLLASFSEIEHVFYCSGSCLPARPIRQLIKFLERHKDVDFIESVKARNSYWVKGGLNEERFTLYFPVSWRRHRRMFDASVKWQRKLKIKRKVPPQITPHLGSQWWCLSRNTLDAVLSDPRRAYFDSYFRKCWIPDESYFQTLARLHSKHIESRSLTFAKFDSQGKPFMLYDDQIDVIAKTDCFLVRKIWRGADRLYKELLANKRPNIPLSESDSKVLDSIFEESNLTRCEGNQGRISQGRFPNSRSENASPTCRDYAVLIGYRDIYEALPHWMTKNTSLLTHGNLFSANAVVGANKAQVFNGNLVANPYIRDYNPKAYLSNLIWNDRDKKQCIIMDPSDALDILPILLADPNAEIVLLKDAWIARLLHQDIPFERQFRKAQDLQKTELLMLELIKEQIEAEVSVFDLQEVIQRPAQVLQKTLRIVDPLGKKKHAHFPSITSLEGIEALARKLRNNGMKIQLPTKNLIPAIESPKEPAKVVKPYIVK